LKTPLAVFFHAFAIISDVIDILILMIPSMTPDIIAFIPDCRGLADLDMPRSRRRAFRTLMQFSRRARVAEISPDAARGSSRSFLRRRDRLAIL